MSVRVDHRDRERFSRHSSRASVDLAFPSTSTRDHSFRSVHSARVPRVSSDDLMLPARAPRSASCRVAPGAPHRLRRHHSSAAECERARRSRRHTLELPNSRGPSVRSRSPEPQPLPPPPEPEAPPEATGKEARRRRVVVAVAASFFALAVASVLVVVVTLTHSSVLRAHNQTAKYYTFSVPPHHPLSEPRSCCPTVAPPASHETVSDPKSQGLRTSPRLHHCDPHAVYKHYVNLPIWFKTFYIRRAVPDVTASFRPIFFATVNNVVAKTKTKKMHVMLCRVNELHDWWVSPGLCQITLQYILVQATHALHVRNPLSAWLVTVLRCHVVHVDYFYVTCRIFAHIS